MKGRKITALAVVMMMVALGGGTGDAGYRYGSVHDIDFAGKQQCYGIHHESRRID